MNGPDLPKRIAAQRRDMPIIVISAHGDAPTRVQTMKDAATEFLTKRFGQEELPSAARHAIERRKTTYEVRRP
jgi:FixJ family two-component response regulator